VDRKEKYIYRFGNKVMDGDESMRMLLGGKGAGLAEMTRLSIPVPPGFTIGTNVCRYYLKHGVLPPGFESELAASILWLEASVGRKFNDDSDPLLVSVRSGAAVSMPGMMDTILNIGLSHSGLAGLALQYNSVRFALDSYRRLLQMFGTVVLHTPKQEFDGIIDAVRAREGVASDSELSSKALQQICVQFSEAVERCAGRTFPEDANEQLTLSINAVFESWSNDRATYYRRLNSIPGNLGTAVTVQAMVFGNTGMDSGSGVGFTRNPSTGVAEIFGEFLVNAQGEDIVAGTRTPVSLGALATSMPQVYTQLAAIVLRLEQHYRDAQDFEFTVEEGRLFLLQTRSAKRSAIAAVRIAVDMVADGLISKREAVAQVPAASVTEILAPQFDHSADTATVIVTGIPASPGAAVGRIALSAEEAVRMAAIPESDPIILVRQETMAEDIHGMDVAVGFLTARGGATSHAAVVARGMGKCCITGAQDILVDEVTRVVRIGDVVLDEGDWISLDASTGRVFAGKLAMQPGATNDPTLDTLLQWAIELNMLTVRANADTPDDARRALAAGAQGIGLCRTEHMFFAPDRLPHVRAMILAATTEERKSALNILLPMQQNDFEHLFREMAPWPVTVRLLDPPLHEFLPSIEEVNFDLAFARQTGTRASIERLELLAERVRALAEANPMMGHRGCRLSITYPEILEMQVKAILQAAIGVHAEKGLNIVPEIMVPLVASAEEMRWLRYKIDEVASDVFVSCGKSISYQVGTMIELPRAVICAGAIAEYVSFVSFGTNDLTQMTYGFSRDDSARFLDPYLKEGILTSDPFVTIDQEGVGALIEMGISRLKTANPGIKIGVCGEHAGDPESIRFLASLGVDYISCSPGRIPVAQLAAAHASSESKAMLIGIDSVTVDPKCRADASII
jgi:pyruvate,orthophosphate dikinase